MQDTSAPPSKILIATVIVIIALVIAISVSFDSVMSLIPGTYQSQHRRLLITAERTRYIGMAMLEYADAHQNHLPKASHWEESIEPYLHNKQFGLETLPTPPDGVPHRLAMNAALSGADLTGLSDPSNTILLFETNSGNKDAIGDPNKVSSISLNEGHAWSICYVDGRVNF